MKLPRCRRSRRPRHRSRQRQLRAGVLVSRGVAEAAVDAVVLVRGRLLFRQAKLQSSLLERTLPKRSRKLISCRVRAGRVEARRLKALRFKALPFKARQFAAHVLNRRALLEWRLLLPSPPLRLRFRQLKVWPRLVRQKERLCSRLGCRDLGRVHGSSGITFIRSQATCCANYFSMMRRSSVFRTWSFQICDPC